MSDEVEFLFDFGSPNAYLAYRVLPEIAARTGVEFRHVPVLLGGVFKATNNASPAVTLQGIKNKPEYTRLEIERFLRRYHLEDEFRFNPHFPVNTLQVMRGAIAAQGLGEKVFAETIRVVFAAMWQSPVKLDDPEVIRATLAAADLPVGEIMDGMQAPEVKARLKANTEAAVARGVFGSPSFFVGGELYFGKDTLRDVEEEIEAQKRAVD